MEDQLELIKTTLRILAQLQEEFFALKLALAKTGKIDPVALESAQVDAKMATQPLREAIEKLGKANGPSFDDILRSFEGPIQ